MTTPHGNFIAGQWRSGRGPTLSRTDPTFGNLVWQHPAASTEDVNDAIHAATNALPAWSNLPLEQRSRYLDAFSQSLQSHHDQLVETISLETGKPRWESRTEVDALIRKIALTRRAHTERRNDNLTTKDATTTGTRYKPLGAVAVLGPFNLPAHLPNGQIVPALLAGNTVVFKPSELTPATGELYTACWQAAGLPPGVFNMIQGAREPGAALATHPDIAGIFFTGSHAGGVALSKSIADHPEKLLALEMGGNNPLLVANTSNTDAAIYTILQSAFITAGQRCTCARRLILLHHEADRILPRLIDATKKIAVAPYTQTPEPFIGPVISEPAAKRLLAAQDDLLARNATPLLNMHPLNNHPTLLAPGVLDVTQVLERRDEELFGPLLQIIRVPDFQSAITEANHTQYGLAAALLSDDPDLYDQFYRHTRAGIVNWNKPTTGAAGDLPFGGRGASGNHRPAGFFAIDFCSEPVASLESPILALPPKLPPGITL
jgi:succinylglutamic semialdehyde dehydrogenase